MISVIIPAYNNEAFLPECLESLIAQDFPDWEGIVIDDGSTDNTLTIARKYASRDRRIRVLTGNNHGVSDARNRGLREARGEFITFLDSDDCLYPSALSVMHSIMEPGTDVVCCRMKSARTFSPRQMPRRGISRKRMTGASALETSLYQKEILPSACGKLFRTTTFDGLLFPAGLRYEDLDYTYRAFARAKRVTSTNFTAYFYRRNPSSYINRFTKDRLDVLKVTKGIEDFISSSCPGLLPAATDRRLSACFNMYILLWRHDKEHRFMREKTACLEFIKANRLSSLRNPRVRLKNKLGIIASYLGLLTALK